MSWHTLHLLLVSVLDGEEVAAFSPSENKDHPGTVSRSPTTLSQAEICHLKKFKKKREREWVGVLYSKPPNEKRTIQYHQLQNSVSVVFSSYPHRGVRNW